MMLLEHVRAAVGALSRNPLRNGLTMLGVVIAVAAVITLVALGMSTRAELDAQIRALGSNQIIVTPGPPRQTGPAAGSRMMLTETDALALEQEIPEIAVAAATIGMKVQVVASGRHHPTTLQGAGPSYLDARGWRVAEGRIPTVDEQRYGARVVVLGSTVAENLFGTEASPGRQLRIGRTPFEVIGVLAPRGSSSTAAQDQNDLIVTPLSTARQRLAGHHPAVSNSVDFVVARIREDADLDRVKTRILDVLAQRHRLPAAGDAFRILGMTDQLEFRVAAAERLSQLLVAIASVSLLVGGVGIMNVMLISVTERTREIGLRRAIGARRRDVLAQILVEATTLSVVGGAFGVLIALAVSSALSAVAGLPITLNPGIVALALLFSASVGVIFGAYPAWKAATQEPIDALRHE